MDFKEILEKVSDDKERDALLRKFDVYLNKVPTKKSNTLLYAIGGIVTGMVIGAFYSVEILKVIGGLV